MFVLYEAGVQIGIAVNYMSYNRKAFLDLIKLRLVLPGNEMQ